MKISSNCCVTQRTVMRVALYPRKFYKPKVYTYFLNVKSQEACTKFGSLE